MRLRHSLRALMALALLPACGKSTQGAPVEAGAANAGEAGQTSNGAGAQAGTTSEPLAAGSPSGGLSQGGASQGGASQGGGAGGEAMTPCVDLSCLAGADLLYHPTAEWQAPPGGVQGMGDSSELDPADYVEKANLASISLNFSADGSKLELLPMFTSETTKGTRAPEHVDRAWYALELFAGGRFVVRATADGLRGEHTIYGSGAPIVSSTVGYIE